MAGLTVRMLYGILTFLLVFGLLTACESRQIRKGETIKQTPARLKLAVAVLPFQDEERDLGELGLLIRRNLLEKLNEDGTFVVISEERTRKAMFEQFRSVTGAVVEDADLSRLGFALEANLLITGTVRRLKQTAKDVDYVIGERHDQEAVLKVETRVFDVWNQTQIAVFSTTGEASRRALHTFTVGEQPLRDDTMIRNASLSAVVQMIPTLVKTGEFLSWGARITNLDADQSVVIGAGAKSGLQVKDELEVYGLPTQRTERAMLRAPANPLVKKGKLEIVRLLGHSYAVAKVSEGGPVSVGDLVRVAILTPSSNDSVALGSPATSPVDASTPSSPETTSGEASSAVSPTEQPAAPTTEQPAEQAVPQPVEQPADAAPPAEQPVP